MALCTSNRGRHSRSGARCQLFPAGWRDSLPRMRMGNSTYIPRSTTAASYKLWVRIARGGVNFSNHRVPEDLVGGAPMLNFRDLSGLRSFLLATVLPLSVL